MDDAFILVISIVLFVLSCIVLYKIFVEKAAFDLHRIRMHEELESERKKLNREIALHRQDLLEKELQITSRETAFTNIGHSITEQESYLKNLEQEIASQRQSLQDILDQCQQAQQNLASILERERNIAAKEFSVEQKQLSLTEQEKTLLAHKSAVNALSIVLKDDSSKIRIEQQRLAEQRHIISLTKSNLTAIPYMAGIIADYDTRGLDILAAKLDWGNNYERARKVTSIRELRRQTKELLEESKVAQYQLAYALKMFPALEEFLEADYAQLPSVDFSDLSADNHDTVRTYLTSEEYSQLSPAQRNQLALDRYRTSHRKTNWQIGRDYEHYVGYAYTKKGYNVEYYGSINGLEDLGRDLIATRLDSPALIIQCKYWSAKKTIHEKHINQLYGTMVCYCFENGLSQDQVTGVLVTNISISETARRFAEYLGIEVVENFPLKEYPCIKCNINYDETGAKTKIYHLPFDQQYDSCKIDKPGEFFAMTVAEAEAAGFRRAFRWFGSE